MFGAIFRKSTYRTLTNIFSFRNFARSSAMDGEDEFFDSLSYSHQKLTQYILKKGVIQQDLAVKEYLADIKYPPVADFQKGN